LKERGFVKIFISDSQTETLTEMYEYAKGFYQTEDRKACPYKGDKEIGYSDVTQAVKEFFAVSLNILIALLYLNNLQAIWPAFVIGSIKSRF